MLSLELSSREEISSFRWKTKTLKLMNILQIFSYLSKIFFISVFLCLSEEIHFHTLLLLENRKECESLTCQDAYTDLDHNSYFTIECPSSSQYFILICCFYESISNDSFQLFHRTLSNGQLVVLWLCLLQLFIFLGLKNL